VLGKNQSIYREVNFDYLRNPHVHLCRRISGGGTVYHDLGNLSFCFISKFENHKVNNYRHFNNPVLDALIKAGIGVEMDERNNILYNGKKISGNAQFTNRKNMISHGTLLYNADLDQLRAGIKQNEFSIETKAVASVKSPVANMQGISPLFKSVDDLRSYLVAELNAVEILDFAAAEWHEIETLAKDKFESYEWVYGRSPKTTITKNGFIIEVESGIITDIVAQVPNKIKLDDLTGKRYTYTDIKKALGNMPNASEIAEFIF
jgi:lipoate-protein ligase A